MAYRALIVGSMGLASVAVMRAWIGAGNHVGAFWHASAPGPVRRDWRLSYVVPRWSIAALARRHRIPIRHVPRLATWPQATAEAETTGADVLISAYFRYLIPKAVLDVFGPRAVNFHPAPLPRYRGPNCMVAMVLDRTILTDGAMTLHALDEAFDEGPIIAREPVALSPDLDIVRFQLSLAQAAARLTGGALQRYLAGELQAVPQDPGEATYPRLPLDARDISPDATSDEIRWRCSTFASLRPLKIVGIGSAMATGFRGIVGPPTGEPPAVGPLSVAFDASDARVSLWRKLPLTRQIRRLRHLAVLATTPVC